MGRRKRQEKKKTRGDDRDKAGSGNKIGYEDIERKNENFESYYKLQNIVAPEDWDRFMSTLKENLPAAFRLTTCRFNQTLGLLNVIRSDSFGKLFNQDSCISCLDWYPNKCAFQTKLSRVEIRKSDSLQRLHSFLMSETESGYISRQEAVSMIPPLLLDIQPGQTVLDVCAAPGSKTAQIIEMLHANTDQSMDLKKGVVIANDVDNKRCYMLVHQSKRLHSPSFLIINHDAGNIPNFYHNSDGTNKELKFDRILCDVPCSGDGTIRKNYDVWTKWSVANGNNFHGIQARIAKRSLELLAKDGIMVYSTCSMNPMEDESVIASLLNQSQGGLELVDVADRIKGLKYIPGLKNWVVCQGNMKVVKSLDEVDKGLLTQIREPMFPPTNIDELKMERCIRILPHHQDTGGFFVAALKKTVERLPWETSCSESGNQKVAPPKKKLKGFKEDPFFFFDGNEDEWLKIKEFYKISDDFPSNQLMHRSENGKKRNIYFMTEDAKKIINENPGIRFINGGVRLFSKIDDKVCSCSYRITQDGLQCLFPYLSPDNIVEVNHEELELIMKNESILNESLRKETQEKLAALPSGCCILLHKRLIFGDNGLSEMLLPFCGWKGKTTLRPYILRNERMHFLRVCGIATESLEEKERQRFLERQERRRMRQNQNIEDDVELIEDDGEPVETDEKLIETDEKKIEIDEKTVEDCDISVSPSA